MNCLRNAFKCIGKSYSRIRTEKQKQCKDIIPIEITMDKILSQMDADIQKNNPLQTKDVDMDEATYENVKPFIPDIRSGKVIRVYDGDTITIAARFHIEGVHITNLFRYSVRLRRIDSPEMKTKNKKEKELAIRSRDALNNLIMGKIVFLIDVEYDKYGRILADVITEDGVNVSDWMLREGYAVSYNGGTKYRPVEWTDVDV